MSVVIETTLGDITVDLFVEERPRACLNFVKLCKLKYYNYNLFHNIERNFIAQTGDPTGMGDGGHSIWGIIEGPHKRFFEAENLPKIKHEIPGLLSLVSVGKNMVSSQFFFTLGQDLISLDNVHCVIGEVTEGHDILRKLNEAIVDEKFRPYQDIRITHTVILEDPFDNPRGFRMPSRSPSPTPERLKNGRIAADENIDDTEGKTAQEIQEMLAEKEAMARATILEIIGDLPDAEIAPPENVLFVCKLNPVTTEDDLEIIFSRFGKVVGCEVIKDKISGDSLQYAFVEFKDKKSCETAYFKMDNVLIDDRRIHVDFSQSVAKVQWRGKGRGLIYKDGKEDQKLDFNNYRDRKKQDKIIKEKRNQRSASLEISNEEFRNKNKYRTKRSRSRSAEKNSRNRDNQKRFYYNRRDNFRNDRRNYRSRSRSRNRNSSYSRYEKNHENPYHNRLNRERKYEKEYSKKRNDSRSPPKTYSSSCRRDYRNDEQNENFKGGKSSYEQMKHQNFEQYKAKDKYKDEQDKVSNNKKLKKHKQKSKKEKSGKSSKKKKYSESESTDSSSSSSTSSDSESKRKRSRTKKKKRYSTSSTS